MMLCSLWTLSGSPRGGGRAIPGVSDSLNIAEPQVQVSDGSKYLVKTKGTIPCYRQLLICPFQEECGFLSFHLEQETSAPGLLYHCHSLSRPHSVHKQVHAMLPGEQRPSGLCPTCRDLGRTQLGGVGGGPVLVRCTVSSVQVCLHPGGRHLCAPLCVQVLLPASRGASFLRSSTRQ